MKKKWIFIFIAVLLIAVSIPTYVFAAETKTSPGLPLAAGDSSVFNTYSNVGLYPEFLTTTNWKITLPPETQGYNPATCRLYTKESYVINELSFTARFDANKGSTWDFDGFAIFAASDIKKFKGYEVGIRNSLRTAKVEGYIQYPDANKDKGTSQKHVDLMINDGLAHDYRIIIRGSTVVYFIDGEAKGTIDTGIQFEGIEYAVVALGHRSTDGWEYHNEYMTIGNFNWDNVNTTLVDEVHLNTN
jgi:hypothetical protein